MRHAVPVPEERQGIAISTLGKVIKRGWEWLGLSPAAASRVTGLIEAPDLAACLTLNKERFRPQRAARRDVSRVSQGDPGSGVAAAVGLG